MSNMGGHVRFFRNGKQVLSVDCYGSLNLLAHAQLEELDIGSRCGGHGKCGGDRIRPVCRTGSLSSVTGDEKKHLSSEGLAAGWRLGCQVFPSEDGAEIDVEVS